MSNTLSGRLFSATATEQKTDKFSVRKFVLEITENVNGTSYTNYAELQLVNNNCPLLDQFGKGQPVTVHYDVRGSLWTNQQGEQKCITNLNCWKIEPAAPQQQPAPSPSLAQPAQQQAWGYPAPAAAPQQQQQQQQSWGQQPAQPAQQQWGQHPSTPPHNDNLPF